MTAPSVVLADPILTLHTILKKLSERLKLLLELESNLKIDQISILNISLR